MNLISIRIITAEIEKLIEFYEKVTGFTFVRYTPDFAELKTPNGTLAIGSTKTLQFFGGDNIAIPAKNSSTILEFIVDDVDKHYERLQSYLTPYVVQAPSTMPWGNRSLLIRDPDGNLVNLFTPQTQNAIEKFGINK